MTPDGTNWLLHAYPFRKSESNIKGVTAKAYNLSENKKKHNQICEINNFKEQLLKLTEREHQVMQLFAKGHPNKVIGKILGISPKTVEIHRGRVMTKLKMDSTAGLVRYLTKMEIYDTFSFVQPHNSHVVTIK